MKEDNINKNEIMKKAMPLIEEAAKDADLIPLEVNFVMESGKWHLKVFLYNPKGQVTHENCQAVTHKIDTELDEIIPVPFYLEVSSPGTDRKLKSEKEYEIFKGNRVKVKVKNSAEREKKVFLAIIKNYTEEEGLTLEVIGGEDVLKLKQKDISYVKLEPEYNY